MLLTIKVTKSTNFSYLFFHAKKCLPFGQCAVYSVAEGCLIFIKLVRIMIDSNGIEIGICFFFCYIVMSSVQNLTKTGLTFLVFFKKFKAQMTSFQHQRKKYGWPFILRLLILRHLCHILNKSSSLRGLQWRLRRLTSLYFCIDAASAALA